MTEQWRQAKPELIIVAVTALVAALAGYLLAGAAGLATVATVTAAVSLVVLRGLLPQGTPDAAREAAEKLFARTISGYSHRRHAVTTASESVGFYETELRPTLEHILAARLAERHDINLYAEPEAARRLLCRGRGDADLWYWLDQQTAGERAAGGHGIPPRVLARLIDRLEQL